MYIIVYSHLLSPAISIGVNCWNSTLLKFKNVLKLPDSISCKIILIDSKSLKYANQWTEEYKVYGTW